MGLISDKNLKRVARAVETGRIIPFLALTTLAIAVAGGVAVWILSPRGFDGLGDALWWSAQTVTTVGYGDVVPETNGGRVIGVFVMVFGVAAVSLLTAIVTASFIAFQQRRLGPERERHEELLATLARLEQKIDALERS